MTPQERFWRKVDKSALCWLWLGTRDRDGYGKFKVDGAMHHAYKVAWEWEHGPVPPGAELHHLCEVKACVRPDHLAALTHRAHMQMERARLTHCLRGHAFTAENTGSARKARGTVVRVCRRCSALRQRESKQRRRARP